jgi:hypothetical protein
MPFDGSGIYTPAAPPNFPALAGTTIQSAYYNAVINDIATAFNNCITRDGQGKPSAAINWNAQNLTNVATLAAATATFTNALGLASGGTGLTDTTPTNGQLLIGNGTGYTLASITTDSNLLMTPSAGGINLSFIGGGGSVSSINASGGTTGLTFTGGPVTTSGTLTLSGTLAVANGGTGATTAANARTALGTASSGAVTASGLTMATSVILGRVTASTGAIEELTLGTTLGFSGSTINVLSVPNAVTFDNSGSGAASGSTFNGSAARGISYNTIGAQPAVPNVQSSASGALTPVGDTNDICIRTAQAATLTINAPTGSPTQGRGMVIRVKDNGTSRTLSWNAIYRSIGATLPTATTVNKTTYIGLIYNSTDTKWDCVSVATEA